jgi:hypothetical protein
LKQSNQERSLIPEFSFFANSSLILEINLVEFKENGGRFGRKLDFFSIKNIDPKTKHHARIPYAVVSAKT